MPLNRSRKRRSDPTGQSARRTTATRVLVRRLTTAEREIKRLLGAIPTTRRTVTPIRNQTTVFFDYEITPAELTQLETEIRTILDVQLETEGDNPPPFWFWTDQLEPPYRQGTLEELNRANQLIAAAIVAGIITDPFVRQVTVDQVLASAEFQQGMRNLVVKNYNTIKSLSDRTSSQVIQEINSGMSAGLSPTDITKNITERFDVSKASAKRISDTEINRAFNDGKLDGTRIIEARTGQRTGVLHISALLPTTRPEHAARHGRAFTVEDQLRWWDTGANRINCKCSTTTILLDGGDIINLDDQETLVREREFFN